MTAHKSAHKTAHKNPGALRSGDSCAAAAWAVAGCCWRFRPLARVGPGRGAR